MSREKYIDLEIKGYEIGIPIGRARAEYENIRDNHQLQRADAIARGERGDSSRTTRGYIYACPDFNRLYFISNNPRWEGSHPARDILERALDDKGIPRLRHSWVIDCMINVKILRKKGQ